MTVTRCGVGGFNLQTNFQTEGLDMTSTFRGGCWERRAHIKHKLKLKYLMTKNS